MYAIKNLISYFNICKKDDLYRNVIEGMLRNLDKLSGANIYEWANICFTSPTTISRLAKKLGYPNFTSFKMDVTNACEAYRAFGNLMPESASYDLEGQIQRYFDYCHTTTEEFIKNYKPDDLERLVEVIHSFKKIRLYPMSIFTNMAHLQEDLLLSGKDAVLVSVISEQLQDAMELAKDTLVIVLAPMLHDGVLSSIMNQTLLEAKKRGASLMVISDSPQMIYMRYADYCYSLLGHSYTMDQRQYDMVLNIIAIMYKAKYMKKK